MSAPVIFAFDFDGVIADSGAAYADAINAVAGPLGATQQMSTSLLASMPEYNHHRSAEVVGLPASSFDVFSEGLFNCFHREQTVLLHQAMGPVLHNLSEHGEIVLVSANEESVIAAALSQMQIVAQAIYAGRGVAAKSKTLNQLAQHGRVVMVGDTLSDCQAAANANVDAVAVSWGWQKAAILARAEVPVIHSPADLQSYLLQWLAD